MWAIARTTKSIPAAEAAVMREAFDRTADAVQAIIAEGVEKAMCRFNVTAAEPAQP